MPTITKPALKLLFETGDQPSQADFAKLIDACFGTDQVIEYLGAGKIRLRNSDGTSQTIDFGTLNQQGLSYDPATRKLNLTGNALSNPVGPLNGLWDPTVGGIHFSSGNVGLGTSTPATTLHVNGTTRLDGGLKFGAAGHTVTGISTAVTTASNTLPTTAAVKAYVDGKLPIQVLHFSTYTSTGYAGSPSLTRVSLTWPSGLPGTTTWESGTGFVTPSAGTYLMNIGIGLQPGGVKGSDLQADLRAIRWSDLTGSPASRDLLVDRPIFGSTHAEGKTVVNAVVEFSCNAGELLTLSLTNFANLSVTYFHLTIKRQD